MINLRQLLSWLRKLITYFLVLRLKFTLLPKVINWSNEILFRYFTYFSV